MVNKMEEPVDIARAWKDEEYRNSLTPQQLAQLPPNPAGEVEMSDEDLDNVSGGLAVCITSKPPINIQGNNSIFDKNVL